MKLLSNQKQHFNRKLLPLVVLTIGVALVNCTSSNKDKKGKIQDSPEREFSLEIPYYSTGQMNKMYLESQTYDKDIKAKLDQLGRTAINASQNGEIEAFKWDSMNKSYNLKASDFQDYNFSAINMKLKWPQENDYYGAAKVPYVSFGYGKSEETNRGKSGDMVSPSFKSEALLSLLNDKEQKALNASFFPLLKDRLHNELISKNNIKVEKERSTIRMVDWHFGQGIQSRFNKKLMTINEKIYERVQNQEITAYKSPALTNELSLKDLEKRCRLKEKVVQYAPQPQEKPNYITDTTVVFTCDPLEISKYLVLDKWKSEEPMHYQPEMMAMAPFIQSRGVTKPFYWVQMKEVKELLKEEELTWLKKYLFINLQRDIVSEPDHPRAS